MQKKVERLAYFSMHPADYLLDTGDLSFAEHGVYCTLMFRYYWNGGLTLADKYRGARSADDRAAVDAVLARFFHTDGERIIHNRIERELERIGQYVEHQSKAGKASAEKRWGAKRKHAPRGNGEAFVPPDWIIISKWDAWVKSRPARARTHEALVAAIEKLTAFRAAGHDPNAIVANSLANGWQGLFAPDSKRGMRATIADQNRAAAAEAVRRMEEQEHGKS